MSIPTRLHTFLSIGRLHCLLVEPLSDIIIYDNTFLRGFDITAKVVLHSFPVIGLIVIDFS